MRALVLPPIEDTWSWTARSEAEAALLLQKDSFGYRRYSFGL